MKTTFIIVLIFNLNVEKDETIIYIKSDANPDLRFKNRIFIQ